MTSIATTRTTRPRRVFAGRIAHDARSLLALWASRMRERRALAALPPHLLADVGIDEDAARAESAKPFWMA